MSTGSVCNVFSLYEIHVDVWKGGLRTSFIIIKNSNMLFLCLLSKIKYEILCTLEIKRKDSEFLCFQ